MFWDIFGQQQGLSLLQKLRAEALGWIIVWKPNRQLICSAFLCLNKYFYCFCGTSINHLLSSRKRYRIWFLILQVYLRPVPPAFKDAAYLISVILSISNFLPSSQQMQRGRRLPSVSNFASTLTNCFICNTPENQKKLTGWTVWSSYGLKCESWGSLRRFAVSRL